MELSLSQPILLFTMHEDGTIEHLGEWFPLIAVSQEMLDRVDQRRCSLRGGELTFHCTNGGATYALSISEVSGVFSGRLLSTWR